MLCPGLPVLLALAAAPALRPVLVPPALLAVTSPPEPSGLVWSPGLGRYLVVSDDTGLDRRGARHAPLLLAMDAEGRLDEAPVPITGIDALDDAEAICAGPGDTLFVATSHSPNHAGRTPRARRQLLHARVEGRSLAVIGRLDLTAAGGPASLLGVAGLPADGPLDVEALAYRDGALLVGLKSPLSAGGGAIVVRLAGAAEAAGRGSIPAGALTPWAELPLCVEGRHGRACQGLADLLFLDDGSLVAAANAPKGGPGDGGGAVWWIPAPAGSAAPRLLQRFEGHKPEGLARAPGRPELVVVLDGDRRGPLWTTIPLPAGAPAGAPPPAGARLPRARREGTPRPRRAARRAGRRPGPRRFSPAGPGRGPPRRARRAGSRRT